MSSGLLDPAWAGTSAAAARLGLRAPRLPWHGTRTPILDVATALAGVTGAAGKIAADVLVMTRTEIGEVRERPAPGRGASSAMPQKRNPVYATLVATAARQMPAQTATLLASMAAEDERSSGAWHAEWQPLCTALRIAAGAAANLDGLVRTLEVDRGRMTANLAATGAGVLSERLGIVLARLVVRDEATRLLGAATAADPSGATLRDELAVRCRATGHELPSGFDDLFRPAAYIGLAAELVDRAVGVRPRFSAQSTDGSCAPSDRSFDIA